MADSHQNHDFALGQKNPGAILRDLKIESSSSMAYHVFKKRAYDFDIFYDVLQCKTLSKYRKIDNVTRGHY